MGRTGCFIVIDAMLERIKPEKTVDVYGHVTLMRSQRNYMVQTEDQYSFIHEALLEAVGCGNTEVPARSLYAYIQKLAQVEPGEHVTGMELEFKVQEGDDEPEARVAPWRWGPEGGGGVGISPCAIQPLVLGLKTPSPAHPQREQACCGGCADHGPHLLVHTAAGQLESPHVPLHQCQSAL